MSFEHVIWLKPVSARLSLVLKQNTWLLGMRKSVENAILVFSFVSSGNSAVIVDEIGYAQWIGECGSNFLDKRQ